MHINNFLETVFIVPDETQYLFNEPVSIRLQSISLEHLCLPSSEIPHLSNPPEQSSSTGLLNPIIVAKRSDTLYQIIDGRKRIKTWMQLSQKTPSNNWPTDTMDVLCGILTTRQPLTEKQEGIVRILLNSNRSLPLQERYETMHWLTTYCTEEEMTLLCHICGSINNHDWQFYAALPNIEEQIRQLFFMEVIHPSVAVRLKQLSINDQRAFADLLKSFTLSFQMQKQFLEWLPELAENQKTTIATLLSSPPISDIRVHPTLNGPQKIKKLYKSIVSMKFPQLNAALKEWESLSKRVNPSPANIQFSHSDSFEHDMLTITMKITASDKAISYCKKLASISAAEWQKLIYPITP
ncbi:MAG: ParB N-terminal domain-containing protein [Chitinivibrionales bacterium]|nr:ParB N-terminal domain-containing protein [Chitinivibrionales bacterium]